MKNSTEKQKLIEKNLLGKWNCEITTISIVSTLNSNLKNNIKEEITIYSALTSLGPLILEAKEKHPNFFGFLYLILAGIYSKSSVDLVVIKESTFNCSDLRTYEPRLRCAYNWLLYQMLIVLSESLEVIDSEIKKRIRNEELQKLFDKYVNLAKSHFPILLTPLFHLFFILDPNGSFLECLDLLKLVFYTREKKFRKKILSFVDKTEYNYAFIEELKEPSNLNSLSEFCQDLSILIETNETDNNIELTKLMKQTSFAVKTKEQLFYLKQIEIEAKTELSSTESSDDDSEFNELNFSRIDESNENMQIINGLTKTSDELIEKNQQENQQPIKIQNFDKGYEAFEKYVKETDKIAAKDYRESKAKRDAKMVQALQKLNDQMIGNELKQKHIGDLSTYGILFFTISFGYSDSKKATIEQLFQNKQFTKKIYCHEYKKIIRSFHFINNQYNIEAHTIQDTDLYKHLKQLDSTYKIPNLHLIDKIWKCQPFRDFVQNNVEKQTDFTPPDFGKFLSCDDHCAIGN